ncbi:MAG: UDP-N-acetylmuramoyl-L-alanyl-D-glutamate--2,6-diaminopimelate ligase [Candidatus Omnitrophica bacterium]|nr:UDP-N-acetylmuramoyl-L-alanyl-D-glutamate--2,6-diaminopimelate ligase [Candidatus Omnitrophota bacterium]
MKICELLNQAGLAPFPGRWREGLVSGVTCDSRRVGEGMVFVAWEGTAADGHRFLDEAARKGAILAITEKPSPAHESMAVLRVPLARSVYARLCHIFYGKPSESMRMIGVTGTNGKTTSAYLIRRICAEREAAGLLGTVSCEWNATRISSKQTTPDPEDLQLILQRMRNDGCRSVVMEGSSHALDQHRLDGMAFDAVLFTNLTRDHLDYHGTMDRYFEAKSRFFDLLKPDGAAVLNADDDRVRSIVPGGSRRKVLFGIDREADVRGRILKRGIGGTEFECVGGSRAYRSRTLLPGTHNLYNVLGAVAVGWACGLEPGGCLAAMKDYEGAPGRMERIPNRMGIDCFVDYAHTDDGLQRALEGLRPFVEGRLMLLFGCGGNRDRGKRPKMAEAAGRYADRIIVTSDNPRDEDPEAIVREILMGFGSAAERVSVECDRAKAILAVLSEARKGDAVLIAGKGHETVQIIGERRVYFNDREQCEKVLRELETAAAGA